MNVIAGLRFVLSGNAGRASGQFAPPNGWKRGFQRPEPLPEWSETEEIQSMAPTTGIVQRRNLLMILVCLTATLQSFSSILADSPLRHVPAEVAGVVVLPRPAVTAERVTEFVRRVEPDYRGLDWGLICDAMDLWPDCWDASQPIVFVMTEPSFDFLTDPEYTNTSAVLVFAPKNPQKFKEIVGNRPDSVRRIERAGRRYYVMMSDGYVLYSGQRRALRSMRRVRAEASLFASLDEREKAALKESDLYVHLPLVAWRDRLSFLALLATNMARMGAVEQDPQIAAASRAMFDYISAGARNIVSEMQSVTIAIDYDGASFRLMHHHRFRENGAVSTYLRNVKRTGMNVLDLLPDRPFFMLGTFDWRTPPRQSISVQMMNHVFSQDLGDAKLTPELRQELAAAASACYDQINGSFFMVAPRSNEQLSPIDMHGGYAVRDAKIAMKQMRILQDKSSHLTGGFISGVYPGEYQQRNVQGVAFEEMKMETDDMPGSVRDQLVAIYGEDVRVQEMRFGDDRLLHTITSGDSSVLDMVSARKSGSNMQNNEAITRLRKRLPGEPNCVIVFDLGRSFAVLPYFAYDSVTGRSILPPDAEPPSMKEIYGDVSDTGPLLGWSCHAAPTSLSGCFVISADDAITAAERAKATFRHISRVFAGTNVRTVPLATQ